MSAREDFAADIKTTCLNKDDFAETAVHTPKGASTPKTKLDGIFKDEYSGNDPKGMTIANALPSFIFATADKSDAKAGDKLVLRSTDYYITEAKPRRAGITEAFLSTDPVA